MIHVTPQPEPLTFDAKVRKEGQKFLQNKGVTSIQSLPDNFKFEPYWLECLDDLYNCYNGVCAYLCVFFERVIGGGSVDHFIAKSRCITQIYEWSNYRLACRTMNSRKWSFDDVLDPFEVEDGWFHLELVSGRIYPNPHLSKEQKEVVTKTIQRLGLDQPECRELRARHYQEYCEGLYNETFLRKRSPFVWYEANRQGLN